MKKQLITMGAVGLAMAGMNSGACADEVQAYPAATPNAVQTEAKTPQQQADSAREELERAGDEQAAARQNVAERQEEVQRKQDEYNQAVSGQEQAQKNADAKFQDLNEARKKKDEATQPKLDKAEEDADRARQEQLAAERVLEQAEEQQKKTQEAEDAARNDVNDVRKKVDAAADGGCSRKVRSRFLRRGSLNCICRDYGHVRTDRAQKTRKLTLRERLQHAAALFCRPELRAF